MSLFIVSVIAFLIALGILVTVHEYGHFWVARKCGVKVLRFSVGFGKPLYSYQRTPDSTEYVLASIPLGGYVKMLDEREAEVNPEERHLAFNQKSVWSRIAVVSAGPIANFLLAIVFFSLVFIVGIVGIKPIVGEVSPDSVAARAGLAKHDEIVKVLDTPVETWQQARLAILDQLVEQDKFTVTVRSSTAGLQDKRLDFSQSRILEQDGDVIENLGVRPWWPEVQPEVAKVVAGSAAEAAGILVGDRIIAVNNQPITSISQWREVVAAHPEQEIVFDIVRDSKTFQLPITPKSQTENGKRFGFVGIGPVSPADQVEHMRVLVQYSFVEALWRGTVKAWDMSVLTVRMIGKLITGNASVKNVSGPITIAEYAGRSANLGLSFYLNLIAIFSISLAVLNLLPIPLLDGGHLLYYLVELVKGSPVSEHVEAIGQRVGFAMLGCLMLLAFYNDITRLLS